jgi:photosystem II stability/assembly factor-like uncharacterized protein
LRFGSTGLIAALALAACSHAAEPPAASVAAVAFPHATVGPKDLGALAWREVGPALMGGRLDAVAGVPGDANVIYLGHSSGGLYKSTDGGMTFAPIFDEGRSTSIGAVALASSNPSVVYVGTGEGFPRNTAALGDGVYLSRDAGKTWSFAGLRGSQHIARIAVDPRDPDTALVAAMGPEFSPGGMRGIYRTGDGGKHWDRVLAVNDTTGGSDVAFDPADPSIAFAGTFDYLRRPWTFRGGGTGSGLYRSTDGGRTWTKLTDAARHDGLPGGTLNRVGLAISAHHPNVVFAIVPGKTGLLYRSDDTGVTWSLVNAKQDLVFRPFYFSQVRVDPENPTSVWIVSGGLMHSKDGGKTFKGVDAGGDNHDLWIDPANPKRILLGSDMGFDLSLNGGETWSFVNTVPFAQVYRVGYDRAVPYHIMGGMQDHEVWWGPNTLWNGSGVDDGAWRRISDWGDGQYALPDPLDAGAVYEDTHFGDVVRRDLQTGEARYISPQPVIGFGAGANAHRYRFNWSSPLMVSAHDPRALYSGANVLFQTRDGGQHWKAISPDLTQPCDPAWLLPSGGPLVHDNTNAETYCTIYALAEGNDAATIWAGTDDGNVQLTRDGGATWTNLTPAIAGLPPRSWVASIETSKVHDGTAYVTFDRHRFGDTHAYIYRTTDFGRTWTMISHGLPLYAYVLREDRREPNLLFAGTEDGVYASFDAGAHWCDLLLGTNHVPVFDLQIQPDDNDLIAGTHGRGFAILDDIAPLESLARAVTAPAALFPPADAWRYAARPWLDIGQNAFVGDVKPYGATISFYIKPTPAPKVKAKKKRPEAKLHVTILDAGGTAVRHIDVAATGGVNRVNWDLTADPPGGLAAKQDPRPYYVFYPLAIAGPEVLPGTYTVRLQGRGWSLETRVRVRMDPSVKATARDLRAQYDAIAELAALQERGETWVDAISTAEKHLAKKNPKLRAQLEALADRLRNGNGSQNAGYRQPAQVLDQIAYLRYILGTSFTGPTAVQAALIDDYARQIDVIAPQAERLLKTASAATASPHPVRR